MMTEITTQPMPEIGREQIALLERLSNATAVSGDEKEVRTILLEQIRPLADEVRVDALGSILAVKRARSGDNPLRVMLDAHMDEVGFMIVADDEGGLFRFTSIGGIDERILPGKKVLVGKDHIPGVIGARPIHFLEPGETNNKISLDSLRIDIGLNSGKVKPGDRVAFATRLREIGPSLVGKALDNRLGCAILVDILRLAAAEGGLDGIELLLAWSVQEEIGLRGAQAAALQFEPHLAIAIDSTPANDLPLAVEEDETGPTIEYSWYNTRLGGGPAVYVADRGTLGDPRLLRLVIGAAEEAAIPYQIRQPGGGGTDAAAIHLTRAGVPALSISVPGRYAHTPAGMIRRADWQNTLRLAWRSVQRMDRSLLEEAR